MRLVLAVLTVALWAQATTRYMAPNGSDANSGLTEALAKKTFEGLFGSGVGGDTFVLLDGTYTRAVHGGITLGIYPEQVGPNGIPPNGTDGAHTIVRAKNPGAVKITTGMYLNSTSATYSYIDFRGITWDDTEWHMAMLIRRGHHVTVKECGFHSLEEDYDSIAGFGDKNDTWPSTHHMLVEDCWVWGKARAGLSNYWSQNNVFRRVLVRTDGCATGEACTGQPNVGFTVYSSANTSVQNVMVIDRLAGASPYGDFAQAHHSDAGVTHDVNEWLGCMSLNSGEPATAMDPDGDGTSTLRNFVIWGGTGGFNFQPGSGGGAPTFDLQYATVYVTDPDAQGVRFAPGVDGVLRNVAVGGSGYWGINSEVTPSYVDLWGTWSNGDYNQTTCSTGCLTSNYLSDTGPSVQYPVRIEAGSTLSAAGYNGEYGTRIGADVTKRYGADGALYGATGYNALTSADLWPWPNETRIKQEMCTDSGITRGFCSDSSLTNYVMNYLGNGNPYVGGVAPTITSTSPLPAGTVGAAYSQTLTATGDTPITWTVTAGALPDGLGLSTAGAITGTPTSTGASAATIQAANATGSDNLEFLITINAAAVQRTNLDGRGSVSGSALVR